MSLFITYFAGFLVELALPPSKLSLGEGLITYPMLIWAAGAVVSVAVGYRAYRVKLKKLTDARDESVAP